MKYAAYLAIASGLILILSGTLVNANAIMMPTSISLKVSSSWVNLNDTVTFSGSLVDSETGKGLSGKTVTIYREGPIIPEPLVSATTDKDGTFSVNWTAALDRNMDTHVTVLAQFNGDGNTMASRTGKTTFTVVLKPIDLVMTTNENKNRYFLGEKAFFSIALSDGSANFVDPDFLRATYDGNFVEMTREDVGRYTFQTSSLVKFEQHQFGVFAEKWGFKSTQKSITITTFGGQDHKPMTVTATKKGNDIRILVRNSELSPNNVYTFVGTFLGATAASGTATNWQFSVDDTTNSFAFKTTEGYLAPGKSVILKMKVEGNPTKLVWKAFDLYGKEHSTIRKLVQDSATTVRAIRG